MFTKTGEDNVETSCKLDTQFPLLLTSYSGCYISYN